jgi:hypothetical protein
MVSVVFIFVVVDFITAAIKFYLCVLARTTTKSVLRDEHFFILFTDQIRLEQVCRSLSQ